MDADDEILIDLVFKFKLLWDKKDSNFKDKLAKEKAWGTIAKFMEDTVETVEQRWWVLRHRYVGELRKIKALGRSGVKVDMDSFASPLFTKMQFLQGQVLHRRVCKIKPKPIAPQSVVKSIKPKPMLSQPVVKTLEPKPVHLQPVLEIVGVDCVEEEVQSLENCTEEKKHPWDLVATCLQSTAQHESVVQCSSLSSKGSTQTLEGPTPSTSRGTTPLSHNKRTSESEIKAEEECILRKKQKGAHTNTELDGTLKFALEIFKGAVNEKSKGQIELSDPEYSFGRTIALHLKSLPSEERLIKKRELMNVLYK